MIAVGAAGSNVVAAGKKVSDSSAQQAMPTAADSPNSANARVSDTLRLRKPAIVVSEAVSIVGRILRTAAAVD